MSDAPDRIWINKVHGQHPEDWNFTDGQHLTKRQLSDKVEYVHSDRIEELEAKLKSARAALGDIGNGEPEWPDDPQKELDWCRNRANEALAKIKGEQP